jgi:hypothetical protein
VDHIVIGPGGILTVETKSHAGRVSVARIDQRWLKQAYAEAKVVERFVDHEVTPLQRPLGDGSREHSWSEPGATRPFRFVARCRWGGPHT